jgi:hypothetical protein
MFYEFNQNNSGGSFDFNKKSGITHIVIVEGTSLSDVINRAEDIGIYFNGCDKEIDCDCCGDRWYEPTNKNGDDEPMIYGKPAKDYIAKKDTHLWIKKGCEVAIHYLDGKIEWL